MDRGALATPDPTATMCHCEPPAGRLGNLVLPGRFKREKERRVTLCQPNLHDCPDRDLGLRPGQIFLILMGFLIGLSSGRPVRRLLREDLAAWASSRSA